MNIQSEDSIVLSKTITFVRFPLIVAIVLIHTYITDQPNVGGIIMISSGTFPIFDIFEYIVRQCFAELAVPIFFIISGFLFFYKTDFSFDTYKYKIQKRFHSLLIPYIIWNVIYMLYICIVQYYFPSMTSPDRRLVVDYSFLDFMDSFWHYDGVSYGGPIYGPLWFIRDLIVIDILTPILFLLIKKLKAALIFVLFVLYIFGIGLLIPGIGIQSLFFFTVGAYFSINKKNFILVRDLFILWGFVLGLGFLLLNVCLRGSLTSNYFHRLFIVSMSVIMLPLVSKWIKNNNSCPSLILAESSFFIYVTHRFIITFPNKYWVALLPVNTVTACLVLIAIPLIVSGVCLLAYLMIKSLCPTITSILIGGR